MNPGMRRRILPVPWFLRPGNSSFFWNAIFYYKEKSTRLVNIRDGEELSVECGDLDMLLGNVSAGAYENTFCIGQEQSVPGRELGVLLEDERSNLAQTGSGDFSLSKALQNLEQKRKSKENRKRSWNSSDWRISDNWK